MAISYEALWLPPYTTMASSLISCMIVLVFLVVIHFCLCCLCLISLFTYACKVVDEWLFGCLLYYFLMPASKQNKKIWCHALSNQYYLHANLACYCILQMLWLQYHCNSCWDWDAWPPLLSCMCNATFFLNRKYSRGGPHCKVLLK